MAGEPCDGPSEVCPRDYEGVFDAVAVSVEGCGFELVFGGSEQQLQFLRLVETVGNELLLLLRQLRYQIALYKPRRSLQLLFYLHNFLSYFYFGHLFMGHKALVIPLFES